MRKRKFFPTDDNIRQLTSKHLRNFEILAEKLETVPPKNFSMLTYFDNDNELLNFFNPSKITAKDYRPECNTCACALGWAPAAGIMPPKGVDNWNDFAEQSFGAPPSFWNTEGTVYRYVFDSNQPGGPKIAARRIRNLVAYARQLT